MGSALSNARIGGSDECVGTIAAAVQLLADRVKVTRSSCVGGVGCGCVHVRACEHVRACACACVLSCVRACVRACVCARARERARACVRVRACVCVCVCLPVCLAVCVCVCLHAGSGVRVEVR